MQPDESDAFDRLTRTIVQQVEAMKAMVNAFSDYARAPQILLRDVDVNELVADVVELYRASNSEVVIETELAGDVPVFEADADRLRQILHNLIKNAIEASPSGDEARVRIETRLVRESSRDLVEIRTQDFGRGLPEDMSEDIFEPHVTTKTRGSGLGLAIVKKIVEEHGGVVWAENQAQGGASVVMRFPVVSGDSQSASVTRIQAI
jgi:nitrogen fixation/metabolism regulation signal transduction histidine kinase